MLVKLFVPENIYSTDEGIARTHSYYFNTDGNDQNDGSIAHPLRTIAYLNKMVLHPGDSILFKGGQVFKGNIVFSKPGSGTSQKRVVLTSYGNAKAVVDGGNETAIDLHELSHVTLAHIDCKGSGRKNGNSKAGVGITDCSDVIAEDMEISGFQKSGLQLYSCINVTLNKISAHDNGAAGIGVEGDFKNKLTTRNIYITNCIAENNPGDPTNLTNHSGNGIVVGHCTNVIIDHCMATNNGWDMPRIGNGPVGIWCYEADSVIIQHCLSFRNKTSPGAADGGGFDLDGGVTNSIIQYCLSYENQGSGYCMFQYWGASPWYNNVIRYNISENDGLVSDSRAGAYVWNSARDEKQFHDCDFYNNTIYNSKQAAISYSETSQRRSFRFLNNIFIGKDSLIKGNKGNDIFLANDWWSLEKKFNADGITDFRSWTLSNKIEQVDGIIRGLNVLPVFKDAGHATIAASSQLKNFYNYSFDSLSPLRNSGLDLQKVFNINTGTQDFNGKPIDRNFIGACTHS